jgi:uncharacterized protein (DUF1810 family)
MSVRDEYHLERFVTAQAPVYPQVLAELWAGRKRTHWIWFIFPQIVGLGSSSTSRTYAIQSVAEARAYLAHPVLGPRLEECVQILLKGDAPSALSIFGQPDTLKFRSSLTLFAGVSEPGSIFERALDRFFDGQSCQRTQAFLAETG